MSGAPSGPRRRAVAAAAGLLGLGLLSRPGPSRAADVAAPATAPRRDSGFFSNFEAMRLVDQHGRAFAPTRLAGQTVLVNFVFTGCSTVCPVQTQVLAGLRRELAPPLRARVQFLSVSLDPLGDTPAALRSFARRMGADQPGWTFVTGRPQDVDRLADALRLFDRDKPAPRPENHATGLWLIDARGQLRQRYAGSPPDTVRLRQELAALDQLEPAARARP